MNISGKALLAGVMGFPISHSRSPALHNHWIKKYSIDGAYIPLSVRPEDFSHAFSALPKLGFVGCNITLPYKERVVSFIDEFDPLALRIGSVNTVIFRDGKSIGYNSDVIGFMSHLYQVVPDWKPSSGHVVVLGAGGAARAVVVALLEAGVPTLYLINRTVLRAENLAADFSDRVKVCLWHDLPSCLENASMIVNTTSLGMKGSAHLNIDLTPMHCGAVVYDLVYAPLETSLLTAAKARGLIAVDGLGMLLHQAVLGFKAWFGHQPEVTEEIYLAMSDK